MAPCGRSFGCCTGHIWEASSTEGTSIDFSWDGSDEMTEVCGDGSPNSSPTAPSTAKSATVTTTIRPSSPENGLLQQPASARQLVPIPSSPEAWELPADKARRACL